MVNLDGKRNILVVDDEAQITRVLKTTLSAQGYAIRTATDGKQALQEMQNWSPDLIITDLRMPNMDGIQLLATLKSSAEFRHVPVIMITTEGGEAKDVDIRLGRHDDTAKG